jgi:hypothetical protein
MFLVYQRAADVVDTRLEQLPDPVAADLHPRRRDVADRAVVGDAPDRVHQHGLAKRRAEARSPLKVDGRRHVHERQRHELREATGEPALRLGGRLRVDREARGKGRSVLFGHLAEPIEADACARRMSGTATCLIAPRSQREHPHGAECRTGQDNVATGCFQPRLPPNQHRVAALTALTSAATQW